MARLIQKMKIQLRRFSAVRTNKASIVSAIGPFNLNSQDWTLVVSIDGGGGQTINILQTAFVDPSAATVDEMVSVIDSGLTGGDVYKDGDGALVLGTDTEGDGGSIEVSGDAVAGLLGFTVTSAIDSGVDEIFGTIKPVDDDTQEGITRIRELDPVTLVCQVDRNNWGGRRMVPGGPHEEKKTVFVVERARLQKKGLIDSRGIPMINVGDRIGKLMTMSGKLVESFEDPNGLWVHGVERAGHGLKAHGDRMNRLYYLECSEDRVTS